MGVVQHSLFSAYDIELFKAGKHFKLYEKFGAHLMALEGRPGAYFAVYAPAASEVRVMGDFNNWNTEGTVLYPRWDKSGIWEGFIEGVNKGDKYKYYILPPEDTTPKVKSDPYGFFQEVMPNTASIVWDLDYKWSDQNWMKHRIRQNGLDAPQSTYEVHLGSWKMHPGNESYTYLEHAEHLVEYVKDMGFTHVEFMPITEYPFGGSWGYQVTGYFAPTSRYGNPQEFMALVNAFHKAGIGVLMDWVPSHFPEDAHGLARFDGSCVYEAADPRRGYHPDWKSMIFNYERPEVRSFLVSSAMFWLDVYHIDGFRVDAVASMLHLSYSRKEGEWLPNKYGGSDNLDAIEFLRDFNQSAYDNFPGILTIAEESTTFPGVTKPVDEGGLGFGLKWMMGWMNDTLEYFKNDPIHRKHDQGKMTFSIEYAYTERFVLPFSHDEVVHGKSPMLYKMPGDDWKKFANLRLCYVYMFTHPGNKLLFMGNEIGQTSEWSYERELDWHLLQYAPHRNLQKIVKDLNGMFRSNAALFQDQFSPEGFEWIDYHDIDRSILCYLRTTSDADEQIVVLLNFTPEVYTEYRIGVPTKGNWSVILNSDDALYGGSAFNKRKRYQASSTAWNDRDYSIELDVPPLAAIVLRQVQKKS
ncbi:MAG: 1,4-alpha-glucan branching protein GlgB [Saprospiraceae bacterium]|nr:1,4-alpha-glucan branching protein GlgB [Saprospiraceae bacterium]